MEEICDLYGDGRKTGQATGLPRPNAIKELFHPTIQKHPRSAPTHRSQPVGLSAAIRSITPCTSVKNRER